MSNKFENKYGVVEIPDSVVAKIASETAMSIYGIVGLVYKNTTDGLLTLLKKDNQSKGVRIQSTDDGIIVNLDIVIEYGVSIKVVTENIIETVKYKIEMITGIKVNKVNIYVHSVRV